MPAPLDLIARKHLTHNYLKGILCLLDQTTQGSSKMTLVSAQQRYIDRVLAANAGHRRRVANSAAAQLKEWATKNGYDKHVVHNDAKDMLLLEINSED